MHLVMLLGGLSRTGGVSKWEPDELGIRRKPMTQCSVTPHARAQFLSSWIVTCPVASDHIIDQAQCFTILTRKSNHFTASVTIGKKISSSFIQCFHHNLLSTICHILRSRSTRANERLTSRDTSRFCHDELDRGNIDQQQIIHTVSRPRDVQNRHNFPQQCPRENTKSKTKKDTEWIVTFLSKCSLYVSRCKFKSGDSWNSFT